MNYIQFISFGINGMLFLSMVFSLILAMKNYEKTFNLYFSAIVLTTIIYNVANTIAVSIDILTTDEYIFVEKLTNSSLLVCGIIYLRLISLLSGYESKISFYCLAVFALALLALNQFLPYGMVLQEITSIEKMVTPWGETVNNITLVTSNTVFVVILFIFGMIMYMTRASVFALRNNRREMGILIISSLIPPVLIVMIVAILIDQNIIMPFIGYFIDGVGFSFLTLAIGYQSVKEVLNSVDRRRELREQEQRYHLLFTTAGDAIFLLRNGRIVDCNPVTLSMFRCSKEDMIGRMVFDFSPEYQPDGRSSKRESIRRSVELFNGIDQFFDWTHQRFDGTTFTAEIRLNTVVIDEQQYIQSIVRDITSRIEAEQKIRNSEEKYRELTEYLEDTVNARTFELAETNRQLESFSYSISHDLRTPLRAIETFSTMVLEEEFSQLSVEGQFRLKTICKNTEKMGTMIDDLLAFARVGKVELKKISIDVNILVKKVIDELLAAEPNRNIEIVVELLPKVTGDPIMLRQIFVNLIGNAIKYTRKNDTAIIHIMGTETEAETSFAVQDNGCGFDMNYSDKLFGVFQRLHSELEYEGTGVGLAIVRRIIQRHGGTVSAYSALNNGARFSITIPKLIL